MRASVVVRSKDEADRLRLTFASLAAQTERPQVVVVDDGSVDHTQEVIAEAAAELELISVRNGSPAGRSAASNAGAARATGDIVIFLDGDTLAAPGMVAQHVTSHRAAPRLIVRGENWHLRCTRPFLDPEAGTPRPGEESRVARMSEAERSRSVITRDDIRHDFAGVERRAQPGVYPGFGPRLLQELELDALRADPENEILWAAASGSNQSVDRIAFLEVGGFDEKLTINEHRELALRLCKRGLRMAATSARAYHMIHRNGWRDPLEDTAWEQIFYDAHPIAEVALLRFFWASLSDGAASSRGRIGSLRELAAAADRCRDIRGLPAVREAHLMFA